MLRGLIDTMGMLLLGMTGTSLLPHKYSPTTFHTDPTLTLSDPISAPPGANQELPLLPPLRPLPSPAAARPVLTPPSTTP